jgi:hypothetical protein
MKLIHVKKSIQVIVILSFMLSTGCNDKWNDHYNEESFNLPDYTLKELIDKNPQLSTFSGMLKKSGYDKIIDAPQAFTVWAPINDALIGVDTTNFDLVLEIVQNHITRGRITTSNISTLPVRMLTGKFVIFNQDSEGLKFGENSLITPNSPAKNGLLHVIDGYAPYLNNLWEFIGIKDNLDSLRNYIYGESKFVFDPVNSVEIGVNEEGQVIYDSIFKYSNAVLQKLGSLDYEDSTYTALFPDNDAWTEAYNRIESFYNFPDDGGGLDRKRSKVQSTLVNDIFFRGRIDEPEIESKLVSTSGNEFTNPGQLFANVYETENLSNGISNITSLMPYSDTSSWFKPIKIEAEELEGRINTESVIFTRTSFGSGLDVSENKYILVDPLSSGSSVEFSIPNTLSATYNIYCNFVPASIVDNNNITPTKVKYILTYIRRSSGSTFIKSITPEINTTFPVGITKMFVDQFNFEYANVVDDEYDKVAVKLEVINDVSSAEEQAGEYSRTMRIDCIILEPVSE